MSDTTQDHPRKEPLFDAIDSDQHPTEIESLCMACGKNGLTRLLLTRIPHFREVILMAFECPHCGFKNNEIQSGSAIAEKGMSQQLKVHGQRDLSRQVVKSETALIKFEEMDFEIPPSTQRGVLSTIEGIIDRAIEGLSQEQPFRQVDFLWSSRLSFGNPLFETN
jgi:zinc finger protein